MKLKHVTALISVIVILAIYVPMSAPALTSDDSGEFAGVCATLGTAHPSGYPVYTLLGNLTCRYLPFGSKVYRVNVMSSIFAALTVGVVVLLAADLAGSVIPGILAGFVLGFTQYFWFLGLTTEVYTLNSFFAVCILYALMKKEPDPRAVVFAGLMLGFGLGNHYTLITYIPGYALILFFRRKELGVTLSKLAVAGGFFILGLTVYAYIYLRAVKLPLYAWEDPRIFERFIGIVLRSRYGGNLTMGEPLPWSIGLITGQTVFYLKILTRGITLPGTVLLLCAGILYFMRNWRYALTLIVLTLFSGPAFLYAARIPASNPESAALLERFIYLSLPPLMIILSLLPSLIPKKVGVLRTGLTGLMLVLPVILFASQYKSTTWRGEYVFYDHAKDILKNTPMNSIVLSDRADEMEFSVNYLIKTEHLRPDVDYIDCNAGVTRSIYGDDYYKVWGGPRLIRREAVERKLIKESQRPVFYATFEPEMINIVRKPYGLLHSVGENQLPCVYIDDVSVLRITQNTDTRGKGLVMMYWQILGNYYLNYGDKGRAVKLLNSYAVHGENQPAPRLMAGYWFTSKGWYTDAEGVYKGITKLYPGNADAHNSLGVVYEKMGNLKSAVDEYNLAIAVDPKSVTAHYNLAVAYWRSNRWDDVIRELERVVELNPNHNDAKRYLQQARLRVGRKGG
ncbi:MAG: DUF2723 domain-containing protein [Elusimicrobiota bacterium]